LSDIHFTALLTQLFCLTFILLLCLPHWFVCHSFYCSVYLIVFLTFILLLCSPHCIVWYSLCKVNVRQYNGGKQSSKMNKQSIKVNVRQYNEINRAVKWIHFTALFIHFTALFIHFTALFTPLYCLTFILLLCLPHCFVSHSLYCSVYPKQ
jgi:hypothetical protein